MKNTRSTSLKGPLQPFPRGLKPLPVSERLWQACRARPPYQRNDYPEGIGAAKLDATRENRIRQMMEEMRPGDRYMKMKWNPH